MKQILRQIQPVGKVDSDVIELKTETASEVLD